MTTTLELASYGTIVTLLSTELNSITNSSNTAASSALDNTTNLSMLADLELVIAAQGSARSANAQILVFHAPSVDGTNYPDINEITAPPIARFTLDAATTARRAPSERILLTPGLQKFFIRNLTGQTLASSGSTLKLRPYNLQNV